MDLDRIIALCVLASMLLAVLGRLVSPRLPRVGAVMVALGTDVRGVADGVRGLRPSSPSPPKGPPTLPPVLPLP